MNKMLSLVATLTMTFALALSLGAVVQAPAQAATRGWTMASPFAREIVRLGDADTSAYHIEHVWELQYRLRRLGLLAVRPNGRFGPLTRAAVLRFQARNGLRQSGTVGYRTWRPLIKQTVRGARVVPRACKYSGWHACYNRHNHQVNLYHDGALRNSWLVRGGGYSTQTRVGSFAVYYRDIDHISHAYAGSPMPYSQFFSGGEALHGSRYMMDPFVGHSHGCINMWVEDARQLWNLTAARRLRVHVYGAWS